MTSKVKKESDIAARELTAQVEANKLASQKSIAELNAATNRYVSELNAQTNSSIAAMNVQATRDVSAATISKDLEIARARMQTDKDIAEARNKVNREIALWQLVGNVAPKVLPIALGAKVVGKSKSNDDTNHNQKGGGSSPSTATATTTVKTKSQEKADALFPELEPTFQITPLEKSNSKVTKIGINTALAGAVIAALSSLPVLAL